MLKRIAGLIMLSVAMVAGVGATPAQSAVTAEPVPCELTIGAYKGHYICGTRADSYRYTDGRLESFIMGMDYAVWHIWQRWNGDAQWSGWHSLGGRLQWPHPGAGVVVNSFYTTTNRPVISVIGTDNELHCNAFNPDVVRWSGWYRC